MKDLKNSKGEWVKCYTSYVNGNKVQNHTRGVVLWNNMKSRTTKGHKQNHSWYRGSATSFKNFQEFVDWCSCEYGYMNKNPSGRFWTLDKDLKVYGNKLYSAETCMFVPASVSNLFLASDTARGSLPVGVAKHYRKYVSECRQRDGSKYLGMYSTKEEAHRAWQLSKIGRIKEEMVGLEDHVKLIEALSSHVGRLQSDVDNNRITEVEWWS